MTAKVNNSAIIIILLLVNYSPGLCHESELVKQNPKVLDKWTILEDSKESEEVVTNFTTPFVKEDHTNGNIESEGRVREFDRPKLSPRSLNINNTNAAYATNNTTTNTTEINGTLDKEINNKETSVKSSMLSNQTIFKQSSEVPYNDTVITYTNTNVNNTTGRHEDNQTETQSMIQNSTIHLPVTLTIINAAVDEKQNTKAVDSKNKTLPFPRKAEQTVYLLSDNSTLLIPINVTSANMPNTTYLINNVTYVPVKNTTYSQNTNYAIQNGTLVEIQPNYIHNYTPIMLMPIPIHHWGSNNHSQFNGSTPRPPHSGGFPVRRPNSSSIATSNLSLIFITFFFLHWLKK